MEITAAEMQKIIYDPNLIQKKILDSIEYATNGELVISDPTNPFVMLLEATAVTSANACIEARSVIRKKYPNLAITPEELYHHVTDDELANMFAIPAEATLAIFISYIDLRANGYRPAGASYVETIIPIGTEIKILDVPLTILNDILVRLYDNNSVFVEQQANNLDISINNIGILSNTVTTDNEQTPWITFIIKAKQLRRIVKNSTVSASEGFNEIITMTDSYSYANVSYKNNYTNNQYYNITKAHNDEYIDSNTPTTYISIAGQEVSFKIPDMYLVDGNISGNVKIELYETKGKIYLPINKYSFADFSVTLGETSNSPAASTSTNIAMLVSGYGILEGGSDSMTLEELRKSIIFNTMGDIDLPITSYQLSRTGNMMGYSVYKALDVITERLYVATKSLPKVTSNLIMAKQDVFFNTTKVILEELTNHYNVIINDTNFVIRSNTVFKEVNGIVSIVSKYELDNIASMDNIAKIEYLKTNKYFFTPYYYIMKLEDGYSTSKIYDLDTPTIDNLKIIGKNNNIIQRVNIDKYAMIKTATGYNLVFTLISNTEFKDIDQSLIGVQLKLPMYGNDLEVSFEAEYNSITKQYTIEIASNLFINEEGYIDIQNGNANIIHKYINLALSGTLYVYTIDRTITDPSNYLTDEIMRKPNTTYVVFSKEEIALTFGREISYAWNRLYNTYTDRRYNTYDYDYPLVYEEDVYEMDPETGSIYSCLIDAEGNSSLVTTLLHAKGDPVLDADGEQMFKFKKGDIVLNEQGIPTINVFGGLVRYIDILMLEYEFKLANANSYVNYLSMTLDTIKHYVQTELPELNNKLLENTKVLYKSDKSAVPVIVSINNIYYSVPYIVSPTINLYVTGGIVLSNDELEVYKDIVGSIIDKHLTNSTIILSDIKKEIIDTLGANIAGIKITGLDSTNAEVLVIKEKTTKLVLNKILAVNKYSELIVKYDLTLTAQYI